ncbi:MAG: hypothetical protein ACJ768_12855 [Gaiellaceae bacterium]
MSICDDRRDQVYRDAIGWPIPRKPDTPVLVVDELKRFLADRRRRLERRHEGRSM